MTLFLLRHGLAVERGSEGFARDADRPLTPKGKRKLRQIAWAMKEMDLSFGLILSSPYPRARQTAEIVAEVFKSRDRLEFSDTLIPDGSARELVELLNDLEPPPESVLLVGHEPYLSEFISLLISGDGGLSIVMKKGGLCKLTIESLRHGRCAILDWLLTPKQMILMD
jgi:phosphohistidine phosphatase